MLTYGKRFDEFCESFTHKPEPQPGQVSDLFSKTGERRSSNEKLRQRTDSSHEFPRVCCGRIAIFFWVLIVVALSSAVDDREQVLNRRNVGSGKRGINILIGHREFPFSWDEIEGFGLSSQELLRLALSS